jgi:hypothetical protein
MNEKIKQLAEQAALNAVTKNFNGTSVEVQVPSENWAKEFAELLEKEFEAKHFSAGYIEGRRDGIKETARECASLVDHVIMEDGTRRSDFIRKHFGVEE